MERIQHAIAKARAEREARIGALTGAVPAAVGQQGSAAFGIAQPQGGPQGAPDGAAPGDMVASSGQASVDAAWDALPSLRISNRQAVRNRIVALAGGPGAVEVDGIRTRLLQQLKARGARSVAITSPGPGCGKSTVTLNLGFSLGRQPDQRTIVADVDLRQPQMARALGTKERHSFGQVLDGSAPFADNALRHGSNLAFASNHGPIRNPAELLQSTVAERALDDIRERYDPTVMLFDLPPLLVNDDAMAFLGHVDCALIVAAAEKTTVKEIDRCERDVASQTFVLGVILNRCRYMERSDSYNSRYA
ncbi:MAG: CpsD/CapB family tyrosine-protein kinase [Pseudomonadota bacterium]